MRGFLVLSSLPLASMGICSIFVQTRISPRVEAATVDTPDLYFLPLSVFGDTDKPSDWNDRKHSMDRRRLLTLSEVSNK